MKKPAPTERPLIHVIKERWSPRAFQADKDISAETLQDIFEAARWAPSCFNEQPWRFLAFGRHDTGRAAVEAALTEGNKWACKASHLLVGAAQQQFKHADKPNRHHAYDTGAAVFSLVLQAQSEGIASHQMAGFSQDALREAFSVPEEVALLVVVALGYEDDDKAKAGLNEAQLEKENGPRVRLAFNEIVTLDKGWDFSG